MEKMAAAMVIFDFDQTIIDDDSDSWVINEMGLSDLFNQLRSTMPWTSLMNRMTEELHSRGATTDDIAQCLKRATLNPRIVSVIKYAHSAGFELRIISDANRFYIDTILEHHGLSGCFSEINTNPSFVDEEGRLRITPFHDPTLPPHGCHLCPPNMCKGLVIDRIRESLPEAENKRRIIYIGDGKGDFCPTLRLRKSDFVLARMNYPLWDLIFRDFKLVVAGVYGWANGQELESTLLGLIKHGLYFHI